MKKRIILLLIISIIFTACGAKHNELTADQKQLNKFEDYIAQTKEPEKIKDYLDRKIRSSGEKTADALVLAYLNYMEQVMLEGFPGQEEQIQELNHYFDYDTRTINEDTIEKESTKKLYESFTQAGFRFISVEGFMIPVIDYHFLEDYSDFLSPELNDFSSFMILDSAQPWAMDAELLISLPELADRIAMAETYIQNHPDSKLKDKVVRQYEFYLRAFLGGLSNTPLVLHDTHQIDPSFLEAHQYFIKAYPELSTTRVVEVFSKELAENDYEAPYTYLDEEKKIAFQLELEQSVSIAALELESYTGESGESDSGDFDAGYPDAGTPDEGVPGEGVPDSGAPDAKDLDTQASGTEDLVHTDSDTQELDTD